MTNAAERILSNRIHLRALEESARVHAANGLYEGALRSIAAGSDWAWFNHTGVFSNLTFETLATRIGSRLAQQRSAPPYTGRRRVLHVLTQAYPTGGHTRLVWRWMSLDAASQHSVLLTSQHDLDIPEKLLESCQGDLIAFGSTSMVAKVQAMSAILMDYDLIVLHIHPFDAVAVAACAGLNGRPRTLLVNHADHVSWLGLSAADQIVNLRPASEWIATERRTSSTDGFVRFALPLADEDVPPHLTNDLKAALGIQAHEPVISTIAQPYKYSGSAGPSFMTQVRQLLTRVPAAHFIAIGPSPDSPGWEELAQEFPANAHLLGARTEYYSVLDASDVYLDSFPFSSITSMLEAALHGVPVVTMGEPSNGPLNFDDYAFIPDPVNSSEEWMATVLRWCGDRDLARAAGSRMQQSVRSTHGEAAWLDQLGALYEAPWQRRPTLAVAGSTRLTAYDDAIQELHDAGGLTRDFAELMAISMIKLVKPPRGERVEARAFR